MMTEQLKEDVIVVWDSEGKYFQTWTSSYTGDGIAHGKQIAETIGGSYQVVFVPNLASQIKEVHDTISNLPIGMQKQLVEYFS